MNQDCEFTRPIDKSAQNYDLHQGELADLTAEEISKRILAGCNVIRPYSTILDCEIVQFFNRTHWNLVPNEWCEYLMQLSTQELASFMDARTNSEELSSHKMPESLQNIRNEIRSLSLDRRKCNYHIFSMIQQGDLEDFENFKETYIRETAKLPFYENLISFDKRKAPLSLLKYKCKDKKLSEIAIMGDLCFKATLKKNVDFIIDIGAGLGHLSRCLAYFCNINVVTIEREAKMTEEALRLDQKFLKLLRHETKKTPNFPKVQLQATITRITCEITSDITPERFTNMIALHLERNGNAMGNYTFGLVGLHPCGNLAPTMLKLYNKCENCQFINLASCCYNKMTIHEDFKDNASAGFIGFPLNHPKEVSFGKNQLGLALHALESHQERFCNEIGSFKADFYRALVEKFIQEVAPEYADKRRKNVKTIGPGGVTTFREYIHHSIEGIVMDERINDALKGINEDEEFHKILAFSALRHMFAPLLETVVLYDRLLYVKSESKNCYIAQRFHPRVSPRVHVITAFKSS